MFAQTIVFASIAVLCLVFSVSVLAAGGIEDAPETGKVPSRNA
ncbi:hypothetical protein SDC9_154636 [bioreactor metagenome]|uniref:Uncharacterized protein n=1 Tax=bioreactor metagenome TaxID=1076179 RepID=A0A645F0U6_9ZZZZ